ncbi:MAG: hypothetical protein ACO1TE_20560 [Prosthecobacter sp.]
MKFAGCTFFVFGVIAAVCAGGEGPAYAQNVGYPGQSLGDYQEKMKARMAADRMALAERWRQLNAARPTFQTPAAPSAPQPFDTVQSTPSARMSSSDLTTQILIQQQQIQYATQMAQQAETERLANQKMAEQMQAERIANEQEVERRREQVLAEAFRQDERRRKTQRDDEAQDKVDQALRQTESFLDEGFGNGRSSPRPRTGPDGYLLEDTPSIKGGGVKEKKVNVGTDGYPMEQVPASMTEAERDELRQMNAEQKAAWQEQQNFIWRNPSKDPWGDYRKALEDYEKSGQKSLEKNLKTPDSQSNRPVISTTDGKPMPAKDQHAQDDNAWLNTIGSPFAK